MSNFNLQLQNQGYQQTPLLWNGDLYNGLVSFEWVEPLTTKFQGTIPDGLRLGKRVEYFALSNLSQQSKIKVLANNIQIQRNKITLGEIDALLMVNNLPVHLEIVYKFYLFDNNLGDGLQAWIGPNRKDSLIEKLNRLKNHQLPLLYQPETLNVLNDNHMDINKIVQRVLYKAQLYLPEGFECTKFNGLNDDCISGKYFYYKALEKFKTYKFYMPSKADWLIKPHTNVDWMTYNRSMEKIMDLINNQYAPMIWLKQPNGIIQKYFVTWWQ